MKPITAEWVEKAEGDFATARRELEINVNPNFDAVCFHAQQCAVEVPEGPLDRGRDSFPQDT